MNVLYSQFLAAGSKVVLWVSRTARCWAGEPRGEWLCTESLGAAYSRGTVQPMHAPYQSCHQGLSPCILDMYMYVHTTHFLKTSPCAYHSGHNAIAFWCLCWHTVYCTFDPASLVTVLPVQTEVMTAQFTQVAAFSRFTLALLEDSG